jgi:hypothetical protein
MAVLIQFSTALGFEWAVRASWLWWRPSQVLAVAYIELQLVLTTKPFLPPVMRTKNSSQLTFPKAYLWSRMKKLFRRE